MSEDRLEHLIYRCKGCNEFLTKLEIIEGWEKAEASEENKTSICVCGSRQIAPGNVTTKELEAGGYESYWQWIRYKVFRKDDEGTRIWKLYDKCVKGKDLGELYEEA